MARTDNDAPWIPRQAECINCTDKTFGLALEQRQPLEYVFFLVIIINFDTLENSSLHIHPHCGPNVKKVKLRIFCHQGIKLIKMFAFCNRVKSISRAKPVFRPIRRQEASVHKFIALDNLKEMFIW
jgi:hypothetical protein